MNVGADVVVILIHQTHLHPDLHRLQMNHQGKEVAEENTDIDQIVRHHHQKMKLISEGKELVKRHNEIEAKQLLYQSEVLRKTTQMMITFNKFVMENLTN